MPVKQPSKELAQCKKLLADSQAEVFSLRRALEDAENSLSAMSLLSADRGRKIMRLNAGLAGLNMAASPVSETHGTWRKK